MRRIAHHVTRLGFQSSASCRNPNGMEKIESSSSSATIRRATGCQPSIARSIESRSIAGVSAVHSRAGGTTVPGATLQLTIR